MSDMGPTKVIDSLDIHWITLLVSNDINNLRGQRILYLLTYVGSNGVSMVRH